MKAGNQLIKELNKTRFWLYFMGGLEIYQPTENQLKVWLDGERN